MKQNILILLVTTLFSMTALAGDHGSGGDAAVARAYIKEILASDTSYIKSHDLKFFQEAAKGQHPRATVVTCSDSRVHTNMLDQSPEGDLFMVRNIGNQMATAKGSVQYGVNHLGSSLLLFIGHSACGAIKAAKGDYSTLETDIKKELDTIKIAKEGEVIEGVKANVNNQVADALKEFDEKVKSGQLLVVGAVYDFSDDMKQGAGKLNVINVNGETDSAKIDSGLAASAEKHGHEHH
jgi:carbonic anhydrase